jgi:hypothetical protein
MTATAGPSDRSPSRAPEFTRSDWNTPAAQAIWEPRVRAIQSYWRELEWRTVTAGIRRCALKKVDESQLRRLVSTVAPHGLVVAPLALTAKRQTAYASKLAPAAAGEPANVLCAIAEPPAAAEARECWRAQAHVDLGSLLGYPACCARFFEAIWPRGGLLDTTWVTACHTAGAAQDAGSCRVRGPWQSNLLLRWIGVRPVPHLPCSFDCAATVPFADAFADLGRREIDADAAAFLAELLEMPMTWTARDGAARIETPIVTITASTDWLNDARAVHKA